MVFLTMELYSKKKLCALSKSLLALFVSYFLSLHVSQAQFRVDPYPTEFELVNKVLLGSGIKAEKIVYRGAFESKGVFINDKTPVSFSGGIILSTGIAKNASNSLDRGRNTEDMGGKGDRDLNQLINGITYDAATIEFDFTAEKDLISFNYIFGSKEYPEYVFSGFNDIFGFFLVDMETQEVWNLAVIPNTTIPITINTINDEFNKQYYVDNIRFKPSEKAEHTLKTDGFTKPLIAYHEVVPGRKYRIKMVIADASDNKLDSFVLIESTSFTSEPKEEFYEKNKGYISSFSTKPNNLEKEELEAQLENQTDSVYIIPEPQADSTTNNKYQELETPAPINQIENEKTLRPDSMLVYFEFNEYELSQSEIQKLNTWLISIKKSDEIRFVLEGNTDDIGSKGYNQKLALKRAKMVEELILKKSNTAVFETTSNSETKPIATNKTEQGRAKNRRVSITVFY